MRKRPLHRWTHLLALWAIVFNALAMSWAQAATGPDNWIEACSPRGIIKVAVGDDTAPTQFSDANTGCTWCQLMSGAPPFALQTQTPEFGTAPRLIEAQVAESPRVGHAPWAQTAIRAPPFAV